MNLPVLKKGTDLSAIDVSNGFLLLIDKEAGWTSFDVCKKIRNIVSIKKVGHAGTLDPFATGLLLLGAGRGTKEMNGFSESTKRYHALIQFGIETDTFDITGTIKKQQNGFELRLDNIKEALNELSGTIMQVPPMFSAKKVQGKRLYKYAREGKEINREAVQVNIIESQITEWQYPFLRLSMHVSKGTYIRSYAHDLGELLGIPAVLKELKRTRIADFDVEDSFTIDQFSDFWKKAIV